MYIERDWKCIFKGTGSVYLKGLEVYIERDWKCIFKGTGSDPPCRDVNARATTVPLQPLSDKYCRRYCRFLDLIVLKSDHSNVFFCSGNAQFTFVGKSQLEKYQF